MQGLIIFLALEPINEDDDWEESNPNIQPIRAMISPPSMISSPRYPTLIRTNPLRIPAKGATLTRQSRVWPLLTIRIPDAPSGRQSTPQLDEATLQQKEKSKKTAWDGRRNGTRTNENERVPVAAA
ncbi:hypothetical protein KEM48_004095 [Puccinia striiformis f. sp. tritici PST-130]|nr:hypothetical protein KEM48_004095 [Puccinia striiformis f. sp. tritici PST-130]